MKNPVIFVGVFFIVLLAGCPSGNKSDEIKNYAFEEDTVVLGQKLQARLGSWVREGTVCYGLVVSIDKQGTMVNGLPVKAKVTNIRSDSIKMKALEAVSLAEVKGCTKMGLAKGQTWWETEGDLFKTKYEAEEWLAARGLLIVNKK